MFSPCTLTLASIVQGILKSINNYEEELYEIYKNAGVSETIMCM